jgi:hypothetical protein
MYCYFSDAVDLERHFGALTYLGICHLLKLQELYELWELLLKFKLMGSKKGNGISVSYFPKSSSTFE